MPANCSRSLLRLLSWLLFSLACSWAGSVAAAEPQDPIVVQLKWKHAFQFAGFYAALQQGYYASAGLDVELRELSGEESPLDLLVAGEVDYAVSGSDIVIHRAQGQPVVALATIFQHSPYAFLVRADSGITRIEDFVGKRLMLGSGAQSADLLAALSRAGISDDEFTRVATSYDFRALIRGEVDVFDAYATDQGQTMEEEGVLGRYILPSHYGVDFYGDVLATSEREIAEHPERVAAFRAATLDGWRYALDHPDQMIDLILTDYNTQHLSRRHYEYEAITSREMIQPLLVTPGYMNPERWRHIQNIFIEGGFIDSGSSIDGLIYQGGPTPPFWLQWIIEHPYPLAMGGGALLVLGLALTFLQLRRVIAQRTAALSDNERYLRALIDATPLCVKTMDRSGKLLTINPAGLQMLDANSIEQLPTDRMESLVDSEFREDFRRLTERVFNGESGSMRFNGTSVRGRRLSLETYVAPFRDKHNDIVSLLGVTVDVTTRLAMESALQEQHAQLLNLLDSINGISWEFDLATGRFTYVSPNSPRILGYSIDEWTDMDSWLNMIVPADRDYVERYCTGETLAGRDHLFEYRMLRKSGDPIWVLDVVRVIKDEANQPVRIAGFILNQNDLKAAEAALHESEERYRSIFEGAPEGVWLIDEELRTLQVNERLASLLGYEATALVGRPVADFLADRGNASLMLPAADAIEQERSLHEVELLHRNGQVIPTYFSVTGLPARLDGQRATVAFVTDLSEQKRAELTLRRAQKMQAIGHLTGGIAHDFNNILGIIMGNLDLLDDEAVASGEWRRRVEDLRTVTARAVNLTQQLLGFSRTKPRHQDVVQLNAMIQGMQTLITRSLTPDVRLEYTLASDLWLTRIDAGDLQDALLNLVLNARDAMPGGGALKITTSNISVRDGSVHGSSVPLGDYVMLAVSDSGHGISADHLERIFEPFFTTKEHGKGTGLGLPMVFGFVQRSDGHIEVQSSPGAGTTVTLYLPRTREVPTNAHATTATAAPPSSAAAGLETILVVDDEEALVDLAEKRLTRLGYRVLTALDGAQAMQVLTANPDVDLLFTDVVMPGPLNGFALAERARQERPGLRVLHTSGYTDQALADSYKSRQSGDLLKKPYTLNQLAERVRRVLDAAPPSP